MMRAVILISACIIAAHINATHVISRELVTFIGIVFGFCVLMDVIDFFRGRK